MILASTLARALTRVLCVSPLLLATACVATPAPESDGEEVGQSEQADSVTQWTANASVPGVLSSFSPALATLNGTAYMVHSGGSCNKCDTLYWTSFNGTSWGADVKIPNQLSDGAASLAAFNGRLYMLHSGYSSPHEVWMSRFDPVAKTWTTNFKLPFTSAGAPGVAAYNGRLYILRVDPTTLQLHQITMDTSEVFSADQALGGQYSGMFPSLAVFNNRLYLTHVVGGGNSIVVNSFNGTSWGADLPVHGGFNGQDQRTDSNPMIASYGGKLHMLHREVGQGDSIWWTYSTDGINWSTEVALPNQLSYAHVPMTPLATKLLLVHPSTTADHSPTETDTRLWYSTFQ